MLAVAARIPDAATRDQFADRIAHKARITEEVVRAEIRKAAVARRTTIATRDLPAFGELKSAEKGLIWALVHQPAAALEALAELDQTDLDPLSGREIFEVARSLHGESPDLLPSALLQRLSTVSAQLVTSIAAQNVSPAPPADCVRALIRLRCERERAAIQREIDRLQQEGSGSLEMNALLNRKNELALRIQGLI